MMNTENVAPDKKNSLANVSLVLGIVGVITVPFIGVVGILCAIATIVCGIITLSQVKKSNEGGKGMAVAGIILGAFTFVWVFILFFILGPAIQAVFNSITQTLEP